MSWFYVSVSGTFRAVLQVLLCRLLNGLELSKLEEEIAKYVELDSRAFKEIGISVAVGNLWMEMVYWDKEVLGKDQNLWFIIDSETELS